ncbi:MAG: zinc-dependent peptidase [Bacteroidota bacterium]|nr:zinc-dependent peptidase [Bacteroidota bacterium]
MLSLTEFRDFILKLFNPKPINNDCYNFSSNPVYHEILSKYFQYYALLSFKGKVKFVGRLTEFIESKQFVGMEKLVVTDEMRVLISASAIQLTFGLDKFKMDYFITVKIYPRYFYSKLLHAELKGGVSEAGVLMLSWEDFLKGYRYPYDNYNLGLHEMAHVLKINVVKGEDFDKEFSYYLDEWLNISKIEFSRLQGKKHSVLREYGGTNKHEFFAVCVEHFFENPLSFKEKLPDIYNHLCFLLNQDPMNSDKDFVLKKHFAEEVNKNKKLVPIPKEIKKNYKYRNWHWTYSVMLFGIFLGIITTILFPSFTIISILDLLKVAVAGAILAAIFQYNYLVRKNNILTPVDFLLYSVFGIMPAVLCLFLLTNFIVNTEVIEERHKIVNGVSVGNEIVFLLEGGAYSNYPMFRTIKQASINATFANNNHSIMKIKFGKGIFGFKTYLTNELVQTHEPDNFKNSFLFP